MRTIIKQKQIDFFRTKLLLWFGVSARHFPWRKDSINDYQIIIAEILLQRTKAETVSKFYNDFLAEFPTWQSLAIAKLVDIESYLIPIGLYRQRAQRLFDLAIYMSNNQFVLPQDRQILEGLPFMGQYIANAVELLIYKRNKPLLDVNMSRVLERYFGPRKMSDIRYDPYLQDLAKKITNHQDSKSINWAILDFAAMICKARKPLCDSCPFQQACLYYQTLK